MQFKHIPIDMLPFFDTHVHSVPHGPAMKNITINSVKKLIDKCAENKMRVVCLTDHVPLPSTKTDPTPHKDCGLSRENFRDVLLTYRRQMKKYAQQKNIRLYIGGEFDFFTEDKEYYDKFDVTFQPEFKLLGQHFIDTINVIPDKNSRDCYGETIQDRQQKNFCFDFSESVFAWGVYQKGVDVLVKRYFELLEQALTLQKYDVVAHLDLINKYNEGNTYFKEDALYKKYVQRILTCMHDKQVILEINLGGVQAAKRLVPREWIIKEAIDYGIPITLGSDAHSTEELSQGWPFAIDLLKKMGAKEIAVPEYEIL